MESGLLCNIISAMTEEMWHFKTRLLKKLKIKIKERERK